MRRCVDAVSQSKASRAISGGVFCLNCHVPLSGGSTAAPRAQGCSRSLLSIIVSTLSEATLPQEKKGASPGEVKEPSRVMSLQRDERDKTPGGPGGGGAAGPTCPPPPQPPEHPPASSIFPCSLFAQSPAALLEGINTSWPSSPPPNASCFPISPSAGPLKPTSLPLICGPSHLHLPWGSPGCMGAEFPGKPSTLTVGQGFSRLVPIWRSLGIKPMPTGSPDPHPRDLPPAGPWAA